MTRLYNMYFNFMSNLKNKRGQGMIEYILIVALIGVALIVTLGLVNGAIQTKFNQVITELGK